MSFRSCFPCTRGHARGWPTRRQRPGSSRAGVCGCSTRSVTWSSSRCWTGAASTLTDSGGIQEETTILGIPCLTLRENTERPITVTSGTNVIVGTDPGRIMAAWQRIKAESVTTTRPPRWDGQTAQRIVDVLRGEFTIER